MHFKRLWQAECDTAGITAAVVSDFYEDGGCFGLHVFTMPEFEQHLKKFTKHEIEFSAAFVANNTFHFSYASPPLTFSLDSAMRHSVVATPESHPNGAMAPDALQALRNYVSMSMFLSESGLYWDATADAEKFLRQEVEAEGDVIKHMDRFYLALGASVWIDAPWASRLWSFIEYMDEPCVPQSYKKALKVAFP